MNIFLSRPPGYQYINAWQCLAQGPAEDHPQGIFPQFFQIAAMVKGGINQGAEKPLDYRHFPTAQM
jgi:hypothetical protein